MKKSKILKTIFAIIIVFLQLLLCTKNVNATNIDETKNLERGKKGYYCVQKWDGSKWIYLTYNQTFYTDVDGQKYIAYCLSPGLPGVGYVSGEKETYQVKVKELLNNDKIWRIMKNGYPYKTLNELGVETEDDAYFATMQAINCVLRGYTLEQTKNLYSPGKFSINGENLEDIQRRGTKTLNAMYNLINIGLNGTEKRGDLLNISIVKVSEFSKDKENYYSQVFKIESSSEISEYKIVNFEKFPEGSFVTDLNGNKKADFKKGENFKIMIPQDKIYSDINARISIKAKQKNYPIYYSSSLLNGYQDYALCSNLYSEVYANTDIYINSNKSKLIINKFDSETKNPIEGVKFEITNSKGKTNSYITDKNGQIILANQYQGNLKIKETEAKDGYRINNTQFDVKLGFNEIKQIDIPNELQKGNIKIIKVDKDNENVKLEGIKFQIINNKGKIEKEGITDKNGEIIFNDLVVGKYTIKEVETKEKYKLINDEIVVELKDKETKEIVIKNELQKGNIKIIKVDKNDENIKLEGVKFKLINENNQIIKTDITNKNGEIIWKDLIVGKYTIVEENTIEGYINNNEKIKIIVEEDKTNVITVKNEKQPKEEKIPEEKDTPKVEKPQKENKQKEIVVEKELPKTGSNTIIIKQYIGLNLLMLGIYCIVYIIKKYLIKRVMHKKQK